MHINYYNKYKKYKNKYLILKSKICSIKINDFTNHILLSGGKNKYIKQKDIPYRCHLSAKIIKKLKSIKYKKNMKYFKPSGLWYSIKHYWLENLRLDMDYDAIDYTQNNPEQEYNITNKYIYEILIKRNDITDLNNPNKDKLLILKTHNDLINFTKKYLQQKKTKNELKLEKIWSKTNEIDWYKVSTDYEGIEIPKFIKKSHVLYQKKYYNTGWYYGWDVPSGVIWNINVINDIKLIK